MYIMKSYQSIIKELRQDSDLSQSKIAEVIQTTQQQYSKYENGHSEIPAKTIASLAKFYNISADYLLNLKSDKLEGRSIEDIKKIDPLSYKIIKSLNSLNEEDKNDVLEYINLLAFKRCNSK